MYVEDTSATWTYGTNTVRASNNTPASWSTAQFNAGSSVANGCVVLVGLPEERVDAVFSQLVGGSNTDGEIGVGLNSTSAISSFGGRFDTTSTNAEGTVTAETYTYPLGLATLCMVELWHSGSNASFHGAALSPGGQLNRMKVGYRG